MARKQAVKAEAKTAAKTVRGAPTGANNGKAKLTEANVRKIKQYLAKHAGDRGAVTRLSKEYGVTGNNIRAIQTGLTWRHVDA